MLTKFLLINPRSYDQSIFWLAYYLSYDQSLWLKNLLSAKLINQSFFITFFLLIDSNFGYIVSSYRHNQSFTLITFFLLIDTINLYFDYILSSYQHDQYLNVVNLTHFPFLSLKQSLVMDGVEDNIHVIIWAIILHNFPRW